VSDAKHESGLDTIVNTLPKFIESQASQRRNGDVVPTQLVKSSSFAFDVCNQINSAFDRITNKFEVKMLKYGNSSDLEVIQKLSQKVDQANFDIDNTTWEGWLKNTDDPGLALTAVMLLGDNTTPVDDFIAENRYGFETFVQWITAIRWYANHARHETDANYMLKPEYEHSILEFLNQDDFSSMLKSIAVVAFCSSYYTIPGHNMLSVERLAEEFELIKNRIESACENAKGSSLEVYERRLNNLVWGPKQYQRDQDTIKIAHAALEDNKIVAFYGLGGVGKTALAQKLMFDIINNREPYSHIVTHSSKVGSDQKEINTLSPHEHGIYSETDLKVSVMDSSLIEDDSARVIGGLITLLKKIYKEITLKSAPDIGIGRLKKKVFELLKKPEHQVLIVLDNFEDIEDNLEDQDVFTIRSEMKKFLTEFSELQGMKSRIIITTRSTPLPQAYGIAIHHLTKNEAMKLFLEKIRFRGQRASQTHQQLQKTLIQTHQLITTNPGLEEKVVKAFDVWDSVDHHIAHPLLVLLAAEEVNENDISHIENVIGSWSLGPKAKNVIEYCVSKTFGALEQVDLDVLEILVVRGTVSMEITTSKVRKFIESSDDLNDSIDDNRLNDLLLGLSDRTFIHSAPSTALGNQVCYFWNRIVFEHLKTRFERNEQPRVTKNEVVISEEHISQDLNDSLEEFPIEVKFLRDWVKSDVLLPIKVSDILDPLQKSIATTHNQLLSITSSQKAQYTTKSLLENLDYQSFELVKMIETLVNFRTSSPDLKGIQPGTTRPVGDVIDTLLKCLGRQSRCWRIASLLENTQIEPMICMRWSIHLLERVHQWSNLFHTAGLLDQDKYDNLIRKTGTELITISNTDVILNETQIEHLKLVKLDWLEHMASIRKPQDRKLREGLHFSNQEYEDFKIWIEVFEQIGIVEPNNQVVLVEGYAFWILLRLFATDAEYSNEGRSTTLLDKFSTYGLRIRRIPNIHQYIRSVQSTCDQYVVDPGAYVGQVLMYQSQARNGTLFFTKLRYDSHSSRWNLKIQKHRFTIIVQETNKEHDADYYDKVLLKQQSFNRTEKRIVASFYRDENEDVIKSLHENMFLKEKVEEGWREEIFRLILLNETANRNTISLTEIANRLTRLSGFLTFNDIKKFVSTNFDYMKQVGNYYVIDPQKAHTRPPFEYEKINGSDDAFSETGDRSRLQLPKDPVQFAGMLCYVMNEKNITMQQYAKVAKKRFGHYDSNGAFFIFLSRKRFDANWLEQPIEIPQNWNHLVKGVEKAIENHRSRTQNEIDPEIVRLYFKEVLEHGPESNNTMFYGSREDNV
jgi:hypothetical protein